MRGTLLLAGLLVATTLGLAGSATAACTSAPTGVGGFYVLCTPSYVETPSCSSNAPGSFRVYNQLVDSATGHVQVRGEAWQNDCGWVRGTTVASDACLRLNYDYVCAGGRVAQNEWHYGGTDYLDTRAVASLQTPATGRTAVTVAQTVRNGACTLTTPAGAQDCGPVPAVQVPDLPHL